MRMALAWWLLAGVAAQSVTACGTAPVGKPTVDVATVQARAGSVDRDSTRADVHALLGEPWLVNDALGVELYRVEGRQHIVAFLPLPVPFPSDKLGVYSLVVYGNDGKVAASDSAFVQRETSSAPMVVLRAANFQFAYSTRATLSMTYESFRRNWPVAAAGTCTLMIACDPSRVDAIHGQGFRSCATRYAVDDAESRAALVLDPAVVRGEAMSEARCTALGGARLGQDGGCIVNPHLLYPVIVPAGAHQVHFGLHRYGERVTTNVACVGGEISFATVGGSFMSCMRLQPVENDGLSKGRTVTIGRESPKAEQAHWVIVNDDGNWLVPVSR